MSKETFEIDLGRLVHIHSTNRFPPRTTYISFFRKMLRFSYSASKSKTHTEISACYHRKHQHISFIVLRHRIGFTWDKEKLSLKSLKKRFKNG